MTTLQQHPPRQQPPAPQSAASAQRVVNVQLEDTPLNREVHLPASYTLPQLQAAAAASYPVHSPIALSYCDNEGDVIAINDEESLVAARHCFDSNNLAHRYRACSKAQPSLVAATAERLQRLQVSEAAAPKTTTTAPKTTTTAAPSARPTGGTSFTAATAAAAAAAAARSAPTAPNSSTSNFDVTYPDTDTITAQMMSDFSATNSGPNSTFITITQANALWTSDTQPDFIIVGAGVAGINAALGLANNPALSEQRIWILESGLPLSAVNIVRDKSFTDNPASMATGATSVPQFGVSVSTVNEPPTLDPTYVPTSVLYDQYRAIGGGALALNQPHVAPTPYLNDGGMSYSPVLTALGDHLQTLDQKTLDTYTIFDDAGQTFQSYYGGQEATALPIRQLAPPNSASPYDNAATTTLLANLGQLQWQSATPTDDFVPRGYFGLQGQVQSAEAQFLTSNLATDFSRLNGYNPFESLLAWQLCQPASNTNIIQVVYGCTVNQLMFNPATIGPSPTDYATVSGINVLSDGGATTYTWMLESTIPILLCNGCPGAPQLLMRSITAASFVDTGQYDTFLWFSNRTRAYVGKNISGKRLVSFVCAGNLYDYATGAALFPAVSSAESQANADLDGPLVSIINLSPEYIRSGTTDSERATAQPASTITGQNNAICASEMMIVIQPRQFVPDTATTPTTGWSQAQIKAAVDQIYKQIPYTLRNMPYSGGPTPSGNVAGFDKPTIYNMITSLPSPTAAIVIYVGTVATEPHQSEVNRMTGDLILRCSIRDEYKLKELILKAPITVGRALGQFSQSFSSAPPQWYAFDTETTGPTYWNAWPQDANDYYVLSNFPKAAGTGIAQVLCPLVVDLVGGCSLGQVTDSYGNVLGFKNVAVLGAAQFRTATADSLLYMIMSSARNYGASAAYSRMLSNNLSELKWLKPVVRPTAVSISLTQTSTSPGTPYPQQAAGTNFTMNVTLTFLAMALPLCYPATGVKVRISIDRSVLVLIPTTTVSGNASTLYDEDALTWAGDLNTYTSSKMLSYTFTNNNASFTGPLMVYAEVMADTPLINQDSCKASTMFQYV